MLDLIRFKNFKSLRDVQTRLEPLTVLAGPNACGKTSVLEALNLLGQSKVERGVFIGRFAPEVILTHGSASEIELYVTKKAPKGRGGYVVCKIGPAAESRKSDSRWSIERTPSAAAEFRKIMPSAFLAELRASDLAEPSAREEASDGLPGSGRGLASTLATLKLIAPAQFEDLLASLRAIVPTVKDLRFEEVQLSEEQEIYDERFDSYRKRIRNRPGFQFRFEMANGAVVPAHSASEGTLLTLGLLALLASPKHPELVLLDNIDAGLHPRAAGAFVDQLRKIMSAKLGLQVVATTHSPYLLDHLEPHEIRLMCLDDAGHAVIGSLTEHPEFERWKDEMMPGEFWSTVGEGWLRQPQAQDT